MTEKTEALRLADRCKSLSQIADAYSAEAYEQAAAELSRLHAVNQELLWALRRISGRCDAEPAYKIARAAIAKAEENT